MSLTYILRRPVEEFPSVLRPVSHSQVMVLANQRVFNATNTSCLSGFVQQGSLSSHEEKKELTYSELLDTVVNAQNVVTL